MSAPRSARPTIVVSGAGGLVGRHLLPMLAERWNVVALTRSAGADLEHVTYRVCDLASEATWSSLPERADAVVHLAQSRRFREFPAGAADVLAVNVTATERLAHYAVRAGASHFVFASSGGVYAPSLDPLVETALLATPTEAGWYQASKLAAEALALAHRAAMVPVVLRPFFIYGAGQHRDMLLPRLCDAVRAGRAISLTGHDGMRISLTHASDAARCVVRSLALHAAATVNVCGPDVLTLREICERLGAAQGVAPRFECSATDGGACVADARLMTQLLGAPTASFTSSLHSILR